MKSQDGTVNSGAPFEFGGSAGGPRRSNTKQKPFKATAEAAKAAAAAAVDNSSIQPKGTRF